MAKMCTVIRTPFIFPLGEGKDKKEEKKKNGADEKNKKRFCEGG